MVSHRFVGCGELWSSKANNQFGAVTCSRTITFLLVLITKFHSSEVSTENFKSVRSVFLYFTSNRKNFDCNYLIRVWDLFVRSYMNIAVEVKFVSHFHLCYSVTQEYEYCKLVTCRPERDIPTRMSVNSAEFVSHYTQLTKVGMPHV